MADRKKNAANAKVAMRWCDSCGTLLLGAKCSRCGSTGRLFEANAPGDIRPCMGDSVNLVLNLLEEAFGSVGPLEGRAIFLNKIPGEDRTDEVIAHGEVIAVLRYNIVEGRMTIELRQPGAEMLYPHATTNMVTVYGVKGHLKGKSISGEAVTEVIGDFDVDDPIIVKKGMKVGPGVAMRPSGRMETTEKAVRIRDLGIPEGRPLSPPSDRKVFVEANRRHLQRREKRAIREIRGQVSKRKLPVTVSFSGGKDSLAAYALAKEAVGDVTMMFTNTGLEFPETVEYVRRFAGHEKARLLVAEAGDAFWRNVDAFGPPAKDFRWCCKVCKLGPISELIDASFPQGTVTVEGNRSLESFARSRTEPVSRNPFVPGQVNLNPVREWRAADIWGFIWLRNLDYNPLYERDFERIGCYLCPACLASEWENTARIHPDMYKRWDSKLKDFTKRRGLPRDYATMGFWRWKVLPPKMRVLARDLDLRTVPSGSSAVSMRILKGASVCTAGGYSAEAVVRAPNDRDFSYVEDAFHTIGETKYSSEFDIILTKAPEGRARAFGGGQISVNSKTMENTDALFEKSVKAYLRAKLCTECGICAKACPNNAIRIKGGMRVDPMRCNQCGKCERSCMVVHYYDKIVGGKTVVAESKKAPSRKNKRKKRRR